MAIYLEEIYAVIAIAIVGSVIIWYWRYRSKKKAFATKQLRTIIKGQIKVVRDPVLLQYKTNPEVYGISDDVALSASILRTRVVIWKTILMVVAAFAFGYLVH